MWYISQCSACIAIAVPRLLFYDHNMLVSILGYTTVDCCEYTSNVLFLELIFILILRSVSANNCLADVAEAAYHGQILERVAAAKGAAISTDCYRSCITRRLNQLHLLICTLVHRCRRRPSHQRHTSLARRLTSQLSIVPSMLSNSNISRYRYPCHPESCLVIILLPLSATYSMPGNRGSSCRQQVQFNCFLALDRLLCHWLSLSYYAVSLTYCAVRKRHLLRSKQ